MTGARDVDGVFVQGRAYQTALEMMMRGDGSEGDRYGEGEMDHEYHDLDGDYCSWRAHHLETRWHYLIPVVPRRHSAGCNAEMPKMARGPLAVLP